MPKSLMQAHVLANLERVVPLAYKLNISSSRPRYQLDGKECTSQITGLVVHGDISKDANGALRRRVSPSPRPVERRQPHSPEAVVALRAALMTPLEPRRYKVAP